MTLPTDARARKSVPIFSGCIKYFPDALAAVAELSKRGNDQHNPGQPLHWDRTKSRDELDALMRHLTDIASGIEYDEDGIRHAAKVAWRALAYLQKALECEPATSREAPEDREPECVLSQCGTTIGFSVNPLDEPSGLWQGDDMEALETI